MFACKVKVIIKDQLSDSCVQSIACIVGSLCVPVGAFAIAHSKG